MSFVLPHLHSGWAVDQAILSEESRVVVLRFGHDWDKTCMQMDEVLYKTAEKMKRCVRHLLPPLPYRCLPFSSRFFVAARSGSTYSLNVFAPPVLRSFAVVYLVDTTEVPDFNTMYELYDPCTTMFFYRNKHIMIDLGTGNNNKINWPMNNTQEFIDVVTTVFNGARKGRGLVISPKDYSTKYRY